MPHTDHVVDDVTHCPRCHHDTVFRDGFFCSSYAVSWCGWQLDETTVPADVLGRYVDALHDGKIRQVAY